MSQGPRLLLLVWPLAGCVAAPPVSVPARVGEVRAESAEEARALAEQADRMADAIRALVPGTRDDPVEIWLQEEPRAVWFSASNEHLSGFHSSWTRRIHLRRGDEELERTLAHELVHALIDGTWEGLPKPLEEGLCDRVAERITGGASAEHVDRLLLAAQVLGGPEVFVALGERTTYRTSPVDPRLRPQLVFEPRASLVAPFGYSRNTLTWYCLSYVAAGRLIERLGVEGFRRLCAELEPRTRVDAREAFSLAAGLTAELESWREAVREELSRDLERVVRAQAEDLGTKLAAWAAAVDADDPFAVLDRARPRLCVHGAGEVELLPVPELRAVLDRELGAPVDAVDAADAADAADPEVGAR